MTRKSRFAASGYWRFAQFVRGIKATQAYALAVWRRREPNFMGQNPLGGWMVVALLANAVPPA